MIVHILLVTAGSDISTAREREILDAMESLRRVPGVQNLSCGRDFSGRGQGYSLAAVMHFSGRAELVAYAGHPVHLEVVENLTRLQVKRLVIDYETEMSAISS